MWTIYDRPADYPEEYVACKIEVDLDKPPVATEDAFGGPDLWALRRMFRHASLHCLPRQDADPHPRLQEAGYRAICPY